MSLRIKTVPIDSLVEDPKNARLHPERNMRAIRGSLERFGQRLPLLVREGIVIAGNGRLRAMRELGWEKAAIIDASDLTEEEARAFAVADNRTSELAEWDEGILMDALESLDFDVSDIGFSDEDIRALGALEALGDFEKPEPAAEPSNRVKPDRNWFYAEFYGEDELYAEFLDALDAADAMKPNSRHEIKAEVFAAMLRAWQETL